MPSNFTAISKTITDKIARNKITTFSFRSLLESISSLNTAPTNESIMDNGSILATLISDKPK